MADAIELEAGPPAVDQEGNLTIWWVPTIADPLAPKLTEIGGTGAGRITYSFTEDGYNLTVPQERKDDNRLTSPQRRQALGRTTPTLDDLKYVDSTDTKSAAALLAPTGTNTSKSGYLVERRGTSQKSLAAVGDKVRVIQVTVGVQAPGPTTGEGKFTLTQGVAVEAIYGPVSVVA